MLMRYPAILLFATLPLAAQTAHRAATAHRVTAAKPAAGAPASAAAAKADNPPGVPPVATAPKPLYALRYVDLVTGTGPLAPPQKFYTVRYTGWLTDGTKFDSSYDHPGQDPITFAYGAHRVIPGWDTGFTGMRVGGKRRLYIPYQLAYGESGREGAIPPKADLIFDIELVNFADAPPPPAPAPPPNPAQPQPNDAAPQPNSTGNPPPPDAPSPQPAAPKQP